MGRGAVISGTHLFFLNTDKYSLTHQTSELEVKVKQIAVHITLKTDTPD